MKPSIRLRRLGILVVIISLGAAGCALDAQAIAQSGMFERTLQVSGPVDLSVATGSGSIRIETGGNGAVRIVGQIRARGDLWSGLTAREQIDEIQANPPLEQTGNTIRIAMKDREFRNVSISYQLTVPADTRVRSRTGSGDQQVGDLLGPLDASTGSGSITSGRIGGHVSVSTGSGDIELGGGSGLDARTGSGSIHVSAVVGPLKARTGSGDIAANGEPAGEWTLETGSGDVTIGVSAAAGFDLDARTGSGTIDTARPLQWQGRLSRNHVQGRAGAGGASVKVTTGSGSIRIN